ncbi:MAG TPA: carboxypeptidase-like regulatory domain-containing protein, partial [Patescibacteria group bacterium]|nr:carboxypeptidase-like regulatory domain-containing protein [Patescibacteria group bacterium]
FRNGQRFGERALPDHPAMITADFNFYEKEQSWYCVRLWGGDSKRERAITSAFYFGPYAPPPPTLARIHAKIADARSGAALSGSLVEVTYAGTLSRRGTRHGFSSGEGQLQVPGTVRLRAEAKGYRPLELSPVVDNPELINLITGLSDFDLLNWATFERVRAELSKIELEFKLERN